MPKVLTNNSMIKVTPDTSLVIQDIAFEEGYHWVEGETTYKHTTEPYLVLRGTEILYSSDNCHNPKKEPVTQITAEAVIFLYNLNRNK